MVSPENIASEEKRSEDRYRMLVEQSPDGIAIYDDQGRFHEVNTRACDMLGYTRDEVLALNVADVIAPEDLERMPLRYDMLKSGLPVIDERVLVHKDGTRLPVEVSARMLSDGTVQVLVRDITARKKMEAEVALLNKELEERVQERTQQLESANRELRAEVAERKRMEDALRISQTQLQRLVEADILSIIVADFEGNILYANNAFLQMLGYTREELQAGKLKWNDLTPDEYAPLDREAIHELQARGAAERFEKAYRHKSGRLVPVLIGAARLEGSSNLAVAYIVDISERKKLEELLREREHEISTLVQNAPYVIFRLDRHLRHLFINGAVQAASGIEADKFLGKTGRELGLPTDACDVFEAACRYVLSSGEEQFTEYVIGGRWWRSRIVPERGPSGQVESLLGVTEDITERKLLEAQVLLHTAQLQEQYERIATVFNGINIGVSLTDEEGRYQLVNDAWLSLTGYKREDVLGRTQLEFSTSPAREFEWELVRGIMSRGDGVHLTEYLFRNESLNQGRYFDVSITPLKNHSGEVTGLLSVIIDVSDKVLARRQLEEQKERLASIVNEMPAGVFIARGNAEARTIRWLMINRQGSQQIEVARHDTSSLDVREIGEGGSEDVRPAERAEEAIAVEHMLALQRTLWTGEPVGPQESSVHYRQGDTRYFLLNTALLSEENSEREAILVSQDITGRKEGERERERLLRLEQEARREAEEAVQTRDELLAIVSHDLKNPLTAIKGYSQLLRRRLSMLEPLVAERFEQVITRIDESSQKMNHLLNDLLDFGRLQAGQALSLQRRPANLVELARHAASEARRSSSAHSVILDAQEESIIGRWDATRLEQMLANLLSNAIKYSPHGGTITIRVWREDQPSAGPVGEQAEGHHDAQRRPSGWAVLAVEDQGIGIAEDELPQIFEWFRRAKNVAGRISGAGIGLASAKYIVTQHGGEISVSSQRGVGTVFTVRLPIGSSTGEHTGQPRHS